MKENRVDQNPVNRGKQALTLHQSRNKRADFLSGIIKNAGQVQRVVGEYASGVAVEYDQRFEITSSKILNDFIHQPHGVLILEDIYEIDLDGLEGLM